jgi:hypothetical protein
MPETSLRIFLRGILRARKKTASKFPFFKALLMKIPWPRGFAFENRSRVYIYFFRRGARTAPKMTEAVVFAAPRKPFQAKEPFKRSLGAA